MRSDAMIRRLCAAETAAGVCGQHDRAAGKRQRQRRRASTWLRQNGDRVRWLQGRVRVLVCDCVQVALVCAVNWVWHRREVQERGRGLRQRERHR